MTVEEGWRGRFYEDFEVGHVYEHPLGKTDSTIYSRSEVLENGESKSREHVGVVTVKTTGYNLDGTVVTTFRRTVMVYKRGHAPPEPRRYGREKA